MRKKIGELLVDAKAVTADQVKTALGQQRAFGGKFRLGETLVSLGMTKPEAVARALSLQFDLPYIELPNIPEGVSALVPVDFQDEHRVVPFRLEQDGKVERLHLAVADPSRLDVVDDLRFQLNKPVKVYVAPTDAIDGALAALRGDQVDPVEPVALDDDATDEGPEITVERTPAHEVTGGWFPSATPALVPAASAESQDGWRLAEPSAPEAHAWPVAPPSAAEPSPAPAAEASTGSTLDVLIGIAEEPPPAPAPRPAPSATPPAAVVRFGGAAAASKVPSPGSPGEASAPAAPQFSDQDLAVLDGLERLSEGEETMLSADKIKPERLVATVIRLLMKKGVIAEQELLEELSRK